MLDKMINENKSEKSDGIHKIKLEGSNDLSEYCQCKMNRLFCM